MDYDVRAMILEEPRKALRGQEIVGWSVRDPNISCPAFRECPDQVLTQESFASRHRKTVFLEEPAHCSLIVESARPGWPMPWIFVRTSVTSASTIMRTSSLKVTLGSHPKTCLARLASPSSRSTSVGR